MTATTPNYHDITVEHVIIRGGTNVGTIVGLPEEPFYHITLRDVAASATTGLVVRNATVDVEGHTVFTVASGPIYVLESDGYVHS